MECNFLEVQGSSPGAHSLLKIATLGVLLVGCGHTKKPQVKPPTPRRTVAAGAPELIEVDAPKELDLKRVRFKRRSATLSDEAREALGKLAEALANADDVEMLEIQGYAERREGNPWTLSQKRSEAVRAFLVEAGVAEDRLRSQPFGPAPAKATEDGEKDNRCVDFVVLKQQ